MAKSPTALDHLTKVKEAIETLPDEKDGLDLKQHKRKASIVADQLANDLRVLAKLTQ